MKELVIDEVVARKFLLGQLSPEEQGRIEELAFEDRDTFTFLESIEADLIDDFIQDELSPHEKQRFEEHFLAFPGRQHNLKINNLLQKGLNAKAREEITDDPRPWFGGWFNRQRPWLQFSLTAAVLALLALAVWLFIRTRIAQQPEPIQANNPTVVPSPEPRISPSPSLEPAPSPVHVENKRRGPTPEKQQPVPTYIMLLPSASTRAKGGEWVELPPGASSMPVELPLITTTKFTTYEAALENDAGTVLERWTNLKAQRLQSPEALQARRFRSARALRIHLPVALLNPGESYRVIVSGVDSKGAADEIAGYPFQVKE